MVGQEDAAGILGFEIKQGMALSVMGQKFAY